VQTLLQNLLNGIAVGAIYALIALGYTMVYGILKLINFAHGDVFMLGAFVGYYSGRWAAAHFGDQAGSGMSWGVFAGIMLLAMRAVSFNYAIASLMGIPTDRITSMTFVLGSSLAAVAAILYGLSYPKIDPLMGIMPGLKAFIAAVLGGIGNVPGAVVGGLIIG